MNSKQAKRLRQLVRSQESNLSARRYESVNSCKTVEVHPGTLVVDPDSPRGLYHTGKRMWRQMSRGA